MLILTDYTNKETNAKKLQNLSKLVNLFEMKNHFKASVPSAVGSDPSTDLPDFRKHIFNLIVFSSVRHINSTILCLFHFKYIKQIQQFYLRLSQASEDLGVVFFLTRTSAEGVNIKASKAAY